ncbi:MAG TPA: hypothetical protein ENI88_10765 [Desulfobulbus sp.]|nr:hypothetical protein [Desulfobulbus sp.]
MGGNPAPSPERGITRSRWFEQHRNHFIRRIVDDFFSLVRSFQQLYGVYLECRNTQGHGNVDLLCPETQETRAQMWNRLTEMIGTETEKGMLWQLKDLCHQVWPEQDRAYDVHGSLMDWLLGSVFHEAMKLKENIYLLNTYGPAAIRMRNLPEVSPVRVLRPAGSFPRLSNMVDAETLIRRIAADVVDQMEQIGFLLGQANFILRMMMPDLAANLLVVRLLVEKEELVLSGWGEHIEELFGDMFSGSGAEGFCAAGRSYLSAQWYVQALDMYERALGCDSQCDEARAKVVHLRAVLQENNGLRNW